MRSDKYKDKEEKSYNKRCRISKKIAFLYLLFALAFLGIFFYADIFSLTIEMAVVGVIALLTLLILPPMVCKKFKKSRRVVACLLSLILIGGYTAGGFYLVETLNFFDLISSKTFATVEYDVVVRNDDQYKKLEDIKGDTVFTLGSDDSAKAAREKLNEKVSVEFKNEESLQDLGDKLITGNIDVIFVNHKDYEKIDSLVEGFSDYTKILSKIKVKVEGKSFAKDVRVTRNSFNVYITGLDTDGPISTTSRSDVNMIATINPKTKTILLTSIPRDYYIEVKGTNGQKDKLTHTGIDGAESTIHAVEELLGIKMNYYVKVNYSTVINLVDAIGGIDVVSEYEFRTHDQGDPIYFDEGENHLDGKKALAFARERQAFEKGDIQRNRDQQIVMEGIIHKLSSTPALLTRYTDILSALGDTIETNMPARQIRKLVKMQTSDMSSWTIKHQEVEGEVSPELMPCYALGGQYASVVIGSEEGEEKARRKIEEVMDGK